MHRVVTFAWLLVGCASAPTQLIVRVDSDLVVPTELASVRVTTMFEGAVVRQLELPVSREASGTAHTLPFSFGVVPRGGDTSRDVRLVVEALDSLGVPLVERTAVVGFLPGRTLLLPVFLARSCIAVRCANGFTCTRDGCVAEAVDVTLLLPVPPGGELTVDAGEPALRDGGPTDAEPPDGGTTMCGPPMRDCLDGTTCECGDACRCEPRCERGQDCDVTCGASATCAVEAREAANAVLRCEDDADCTFDARDASNATISCGDRTTCAVDCERVSNCFVACTGSASCTVACRNASNCSFTECGGATTSCPGDVIACGTACP